MIFENISVDQSSVYLMFDCESLKSLIYEGKLHVSDFHCFDKQSKKIVWEMMRTIAASEIQQQSVVL